MKVNVIMNLCNNITAVDFDTQKDSTFSFECLDRIITFNCREHDGNLVIFSSEGLCEEYDGAINFDDLKTEFATPLGKGISLVLPIMDIYPKFDFNF